MEDQISKCENCLKNKEKILAENEGKGLEYFYTFTCGNCEREKRRMCKSCDLTWSLERFPGNQGLCRTCSNQRRRDEYKENNPEIIPLISDIIDDTKQCGRCKAYISFDEYPDDNNQTRNLCKVCRQDQKINPKKPQNKPKIVLTITEKDCKGKCGKILPITKFKILNSGNRRGKCNKCSR